MPWKETEAVKERHLMIADYLRGEYTLTELSQEYGVSRKTLYKWIGRYQEMGFEGLNERSRRPLSVRQTPEALLDMLVAVKKSHPSWGPGKVVKWLNEASNEVKWPAASTAGEWFRKLGLVKPRRRRVRVPSYNQPFSGCERPNDVWSADFKGQFKLGNGKYCYPLTMSDNCSRYLLSCRGLYRPDYESCRSWQEWVFREYGLPLAIRTDNGSPFAGRGCGGLSRLSVWWIRLGIVPERIERGCPQQNGRHERIHRTLKAEATQAAKRNLHEQQTEFERFIREYNEERPHEALGGRTPASVYKPSERRYPRRLPRVEYASDALLRSVRHSGEIRYDGDLYFVSELLSGERIELRATADGKYRLLYGFYPLGILDLRSRRIEPET